MEDTMRRICLYFLELTILAMSSVAASPAQDSSNHKAAATASATPTSGLRAGFLAEIAYYQQRYIRLAEAMPAEKYTWRPAEDGRSVGEAFTHIIPAKYGAARAL